MESIVVKNLSKEFYTGNRRSEKVKALDDISFSVAQGEKVGLIGSNGSGKTTLLRLIAGIYQSSSGMIQTNHRIIPVIDFAWQKPRLTVEENIYLGASLYGFTIKDISEHLMAIVDFAGVRAKLNCPSYQLSAGMIERLSISLILFFAHISPQHIILIDELFSSSDIGFVQQGIKQFEEFVKTKSTLMIAGHNFDIMINNCNRIIWLDQGKIKKIGVSQEIIDEYIGIYGALAIK